MTDLIIKYLMPQKFLDILIKVKEFLRGKKTYLAAAILLLQALFSYLDQALALGGADQFFAWCANLPSNEATVLMAEALALFGIRAAIAK